MRARLQSPHGRTLVRGLIVCAAVVALDQTSKAIVTDQLARGEHAAVLPFLDISNSRNSGVAFGLAEDVPPAAIGAALVILLGLLTYLGSRSRSGWTVWLPGGLLIGGAIGNLIDRVRDGSVIDFIDLSFWPTFNVADVAIVVGVALLILAPQRDT
ncbi:N/A [soil metagenome]